MGRVQGCHDTVARRQPQARDRRGTRVTIGALPSHMLPRVLRPHGSRVRVCVATRRFCCTSQARKRIHRDISSFFTQFRRRDNFDEIRAKIRVRMRVPSAVSGLRLI